MAGACANRTGPRLSRGWVCALLLLLSGCEIFFSSGTGGQHAEPVGALQVAGFTPANGATGVTPTTSVSVVFNKDVSAASAAAGIFLTSSAGAVSGSVQVNGPQAVFTPAASLSLGTTYTITVSTAVTAIDGATLPGNVMSRFTTAEGSFPPADTSVGASCGTAWTLASDGHGNALLAWLTQGAATTGAVRAARYAASSGWRGVEALGAQAERLDGASAPVIAAALSAQGDAFVAFYVRGAVGYDLMAARAMASGGGWGASRTLVPALAAPIAMLALEVDSAGNVRAVGPAEGAPGSPALAEQGGGTYGRAGGGASDDAGLGRITRLYMDRQGNGFLLGETTSGASGSTELSIARVSGAGYHLYHVASAPAGMVGRFGGELAIVDAQGRAMLVWCDPTRDALMAKKFE